MVDRRCGHSSTPLPLRERFTIMDASKLTIKVKQNSTKPSISRSDVPRFPPAPNSAAMNEATEVPPCSQDVWRDHEVETQDHVDRDRLAQRAAEAQHRCADDPAPPERKYHRADHLGLGGTEGQRALSLPGWRQAEHLTGHRGDDGHDHEADDQAGDEEGSVEWRRLGLEDRE